MSKLILDDAPKDDFFSKTDKKKIIEGPEPEGIWEFWIKMHIPTQDGQ